MQSEFFDNKIKDAADHHHPAYDEKAWQGMEKLLDKHLPVKGRDRRRYFFLLPLLILLLAGAGLVVTQPWNSKSRGINQTSVPAQAVDNHDTRPVQEASPVSQSTGNPGISTTGQRSPEPGLTTNSTTAIKAKVGPLLMHGLVNGKKPGSVRSITYTAGAANTDVSTANTVEQDHKPVLPAKLKTVKETSSSEPNDLANSKNQPNVAAPTQTHEDPVASTVQLSSTKDVKPVKKQKDKLKKTNSFFLGVSAAPDISFTASSPVGRTRLLAGIGAGYTFNDRITVRSGFYSGRKIYSANPGAYNPPSQFWTYYPYLQKVEADCKVYEIPLTVSYHFGKAGKRNWFASTGLSTYIMKEESYNYFYKYTPTGSTHNRTMNYKNENQHLFSVVTLSGGYKRNLNSRIFITAEPYVKLPMSGVGYGKVKLNSGGMLLTIGFRPFAKMTAITSR